MGNCKIKRKNKRNTIRTKCFSFFLVNLLYHKIVKNSRLFFEPIKRRIEILKETGRIEFREGIIDKLIKEFCDSPYTNQENYAETVYELLEMFYEYKNETMDLITDDELIEFMKKSFDGIAQGDLEYLIRWKKLFKNIQKFGWSPKRNRRKRIKNSI